MATKDNSKTKTPAKKVVKPASAKANVEPVAAATKPAESKPAAATKPAESKPAAATKPAETKTATTPAAATQAVTTQDSAEVKAVVAQMQQILTKQQKLSTSFGPPTLAMRKDLLKRCTNMVVDYADRIVDVLNEDFGARSKHQSMASDIYGTVEALKFASKRVGKWMKPESRSSSFPFGLLGAKSYIEHHPYGTVGVISPWNFPFYLTFTPLAGILAAGNRVMIKTSELTPNSAALMNEMVKAYFDETEIAIFSGGPDIAQAFTGLKFDHLLYTGGGRVAKMIMKVAAENLVPLTLELGGKSPVILGKDADIETAAKRVMFGKTFNAGQICLAPDYLMVHNSKLDEFVDHANAAVTQYFPDILHNDDYTSIVNDTHFDRIQGLLTDAKSKGADIREINPANENFSQQPARKIPPTLVINPTDDMAVMQEEIFGPVLPVIGFDNISETIDKVNDREKPLGLYYFGNDKAETRAVLDKTQSGGVTINDVIAHIQQEDLPFGGVGPSGMGSYQGRDGFKNFTHQRAVYKQSSVEKVVGLLRPPYNADTMAFLKKNSGVK